jgi:hypothetical protein
VTFKSTRQLKPDSLVNHVKDCPEVENMVTIKEARHKMKSYCGATQRYISKVLDTLDSDFLACLLIFVGISEFVPIHFSFACFLCTFWIH